MITIRPADSLADLETWTAIKNLVVPNEPTTVEALSATHEPDRLLLLAELDGETAGCGIGSRSSFGNRLFMAARVLAPFRRRGVGMALANSLARHGRALGLAGINAFVYADDEGSRAFAASLGLVEVDYQLEQVRSIEDERSPKPPLGVELVSLESRRGEFLEAAWPLALAGYRDLPVPGAVTYTLEEWLRDEATWPEGSFVAVRQGEIIGYAGLNRHGSGPHTAEHGLTTVGRDWRRRGVALALKQAQAHWAAHNGVTRLVTWTQRGNEAMQSLNRRLGYVDKARVLTMQGRLPDEEIERQP